MQNQINQKVFTNTEISLATFFGGPLAAGFLISKNFKVFGKDKAAKNSLFISIIFTLILLGVVFSLPDYIIDSVYKFFIPTIYTAIISFIVKKTQGDDISEFITNNGEVASGWLAAGYGALGFILYCVFILVFVLFEEPISNPNMVQVEENVYLYYDEGIELENIDQLKSVIFESAFLRDSEGSDLFFSEASNFYVLKFILMDENLLKDSAVICDFNAFEDYLSYNIDLGKEIKVKFTDPNLVEWYDLPELPEIPESDLMTNAYRPGEELMVYEVNENHKIFYNKDMPMEDVKVLETAVKRLKSYFPVDQAIDIVFINEQKHYVLKLFVLKEFWNNPGSVNRIMSTAQYIKDTGIEKEIKVVFVDSRDHSEKVIN